jgi:nucleoside-diphosphate-sugar epimerase
MVWGSGEQIRDFIHVDDVVNGILAVAAAPAGPPVNLCTGTGTSLNTVIDMMTARARYSPAIRHLDKPEGLFSRVGDPHRLHEYYKPQVSLEEGIARGLQ